MKSKDLSFKLSLCALHFALCTFIGCLYYNTYYNAKQNYKEAMKKKPPDEVLLDKAIERCGKLIKYAPKHKNVPDAIFLMAKCFYAKEEYDLSIKKFQEFIELYPQHKLVDSARIGIVNNYIKKGEFYKIDEILDEIKDKEQVDKLIIEGYFLAQNYDKVIDEGEKILPKIKSKELKQEIFIMLGKASDSLGKYEQGIEYYKKAKTIAEKKTFWDITLFIVDDLILLNKIEEAIDTLKYMLSSIDKKYEPDYKIKIKLKIAQCYELLGKYEEAISTLKKIKDHPEGAYKLGNIYEQKGELEEAKKYYDVASGWYHSSNISDSARIRSSRINNIKKYEELAKDTTKEALRAQFLLAEIYFLELSNIDKAIEEYDKVIKMGNKLGVASSEIDSLTEYVPKAGYSIGWLYENKKKNIKEAIKLYEWVIENFPNTEYAEFSKEAIKRLKYE